jgi:PAS domain-containing protein
MAAGTRDMTVSGKAATDSKPADVSRLVEEAIDNLTLGIIIFDRQRKVVFCNNRYLEIYGLAAEQVKPGTPISSLIQHRLDLGLKVRMTPEEYIRERVGRPVVQATVVQEFTGGRIITYTVHPMADGGGMAAH